MKPICYGIIGAGAIARYMVPAFTEGRDAVATAVADIDLEAARKIAAAVGAPRVVADWRELLNDPAIDAIYIATPPFLHREMSIAALQAGKHVCCEKPFVITQADVRAVMAVHATVPKFKFTCNASRFHESGVARTARALVAEGRLGTLYRVHFEQVTGAAKPGTVLPAWRNDPKRNGGGISFDWGVYDLAWLSYVLDRYFRPTVVFATKGNYFPLTAERVPPCLDVDGWMAVEIICDDGLTIHWERRASEHGPDRHNIEFRGTRGGFDACFVPLGAKQGLHFHAYEGAEDLKTVTLPEATLPNWTDTMLYSIRDLSRAIIEDRQPTNTLADNLRIHGVYDAMIESARTRQAVRVAQ
ncbi:MAG: Gfo/Idh/MocA family oxidoreductase [Opitutaceae bacterium]